MKIGSYNIRPFVVVLQEMPEKETFIQAHFRERGIEAEPFNGISAAASGLRTIYPYEFDAPGSGWNIGHKPVATWLSFYMLYAALNLQPDPYFMTLEWDCCLEPNWRPRVEAALSNVPADFDVLFVGSCCADDSSKTHKHIAGEVWEVKYPVCGHCLIVAKKAIPTILSTQRKVYAPWDISLLFHTWKHLKVYTILPRVATQFNTELPP